MSGEVREQTDLATWLLEQIAEDERRARAAQAATAHRDEPGGYAVWRTSVDGAIYGENVALMSGTFDYLDDAIGEHVVSWAPGRVLAECDAKRRIIAECKYWYDKVNRGEDYPALADRFEVSFGILCLLALPYKDREGYLPEWSPDGR